MIKIYSSHGKEGGSTESFINLTNELNSRGYETLFITPHSYPISKCNSVIKEYDKNLFTENDYVILHYIKIKERPYCKKIILSCHEQQAFPLRFMDLSFYDKIHFVSEHQAKWQNIKQPYFINGNIYENLIISPPLAEKIGGVIGQLYPAKKTLEAIKWAINDGCNKIYIYGKVESDLYYHDLNSSLFIYKHKVPIQFKNFCFNKQMMYDSFSDLYFCSENECLPTVIAEAMLTGKTIHIPDDRNYKNCKYEFNKNNVINTWLKELEI
jgi:hypothetical protein